MILNEGCSRRDARWLGLATLGAVVLLCVFGCVSRDGHSQTHARQSHRAGKAAPRAARTSVPSELRQAVQQATEAVNARSENALKPLVTANALPSFGWIHGKTTKTWAGGVIIVPIPPSPSSIVTYLAVFHAWHTCESDGDHIHKVENTPEGWRLGEEIPETETGGYRVRDHQLNVTFDVVKQSAAIHDEARIEMTEKPALPICLLRLSEDFRVSALTINDSAVPFQQVGGVIAFAPPARPQNAPADRSGSPDGLNNSGKDNRAFTVRMNYAGRVSHDGSDYILANEATLDSYWYPHTARLPATATVTATAPPGWTAIGQGEKTGERRNPDGTTTVTYRNEIPTSFFTLDAGRYFIRTRTVNGRVLSACLLTRDQARADKCLDLLGQALAYFDAYFAPFPYTHYEVVETKGPFSGALEAYSFATFGAGTLPSTLVHELSHTWWGGLVPCAYTRSMWNEAFAEYSSGLFSRVHHAPEQPLEGVEEPPLRGRRRSFGTAFDAAALADAHDTSDPREEAIGYGKGALVMRVLEEQIGREAMLRSMQTFARDHPRGEAAEWLEFAQAVGKTTKQDYDWFFAQWIDRKGLPHVHLANVTARKDERGFVIQGDVAQTGEPYRLRLPVLVKTQDGAAMRLNVDADGARTPFHIQTASAPARLTLDPDNLLPLATTTEQAQASF